MYFRVQTTTMTKGMTREKRRIIIPAYVTKPTRSCLRRHRISIQTEFL